MSKHSTSSSSLLRPATGAVIGLCLLLTGCPMGSNPTQTENSTTSSSSGASAGGASGPPGSSSGGAAGSAAGGASGPGTTPGGTTGSGASGGTPGAVAGGAGESPGGSIDGSDAGDAAEPGFGDAVAAAENLPDLRDTPTPDAGATTAAGAQTGQGGAGTSGSGEGPGGATGTAASPRDASGSEPDGSLTPEERVAVLDAELERGTGEFDALIIETQQAQRQAARDAQAQAADRDSAVNRGEAGGDSPYDGGLAEAGGYSTGGGMGGAAGGGRMPDNTAKYPPPGDIPSGNDDDVVARQLREAAMREPDPAVRERLWDEYRKYKGLGQ